MVFLSYGAQPYSPGSELNHTNKSDVSLEGLQIVYEDECLLLVNKPSGMLSQPGKHVDGSVLTRVLDSVRDLHGPVMVHRLDMDTSGLLVLAKTRAVHRALQQQFEKRKVKKRYKALLEQPITAMGGRVQLPLRLDINDRPRQIVCAVHGKPSTTLWHCATDPNPQAIALYPLTGRTHQLRVHAAALQGLGNAIQGDRLYGRYCEAASRLMLHADCLQFLHPCKLEQIRVDCPAPF